MKLELKHLAHYEYSNLEVLITDETDVRKGNVCAVEQLHLHKGIVPGFKVITDIGSFHSNSLKPILISFADLKKEVITPDGYSRIIYDELSLYSSQKYDKDLEIGEWWVKDVELLKAYHVDVYGLIPLGLAIDKKALAKEKQDTPEPLEETKP